jgi:hypothetical protein
MAAALAISPSDPQVGDAVTISGTGFLPSVKCTVTIVETGDAFQQNSDASGAISSDDLADKAVQTLTSSGVNVTAADTVTIDGHVYTFRASVTTTADEVLRGADAATSLANLKAAINGDAGSGTTYGSLTVAHATVGAGALTPTTLVVYAKTGGTAGNSLATTKVAATYTWGAGTLAGGAVSTGVSPLVWHPATADTFTLRGTDGTSTVDLRVHVATE